MRKPKIAILSDTATGWGRRMIRGILDHNLQFEHWDILVEPKGRDETFDLSRLTDCDGIIARISSSRMAQDLAALNIPVVNISALTFDGPRFPRVTTDYSASAKLALSHFQENALQNFAYVGPLHLSHVREHEQAFENTLTNSENTYHIFRPSSPFGLRIPQQMTEEELTPWLAKLPKPIGIFTWGFQIGRDIVNACSQANIPVPNDIAVLGGDYDELLSDACQPPLSGIVTPAQQVGNRAASILQSLLDGQAPPENPVFIAPDKIEERQSTEIMAIDDPLTLQALTYLRDNACSDINVEDILKAVPMARRLLERRFNKALGHSPAQEIRRVRINHARKLLSTTDLSLEEIAESCGYSSYNYLGTVFKKETGMSPGRYRKQRRNLS